MSWLIYKHTSKTTGKSYIGLTSRSVCERLKEHISDAKNKVNNSYFHNALRKYGYSDFYTIILKDNISTLEEANDLEVEYIKKHNTFKNGYNLNCGGGANYGYTHTEEAKMKMSLIQQNRVLSESSKKSISEHARRNRLGSKLKESTKQLISENNKKYWRENEAALKSRVQKQKKQVSIDGVIYDSIKDAKLKLNIGTSVFYRKIRSSDFPTWFYIEV